MPARIHLVVKLHYSVLKVHANNMHVEYMQSRVPVVTWNCPLGYKFVHPGQLAVPALFKNLIGQVSVIHTQCRCFCHLKTLNVESIEKA